MPHVLRFLCFVFALLAFVMAAFRAEGWRAVTSLTALGLALAIAPFVWDAAEHLS